MKPQYASPMRSDTVLGASVNSFGELVVVIGVEALATAAQCHPDYVDVEGNPGPLRVISPTVFARQVALELDHEDEAGDTIMHRALDQAVEAAISGGAQGVELDEAMLSFGGMP